MESKACHNHIQNIQIRFVNTASIGSMYQKETQIQGDELL